MTDHQIANIIFNETRSLSGTDVQRARANIAHAIMNAERAPVRPRTAPSTATVPKVERGIYAQCLDAVHIATAERIKATDPTGGATNFNFRKNDVRTPFYGLKLRTQVGPLNNSHPSQDLPGNGIYANTYGQ